MICRFLLLALFLGACSTAQPTARAPEPVAALPPVPRVEGPLRIDLVYPTPAATRPPVDSTFLFGNTGTGAARLAINGLDVPVAANGAFLAFVPVRSAYHFAAEAGGQRDTLVFRYRVPAPAAPPVEAFAPRPAVVVAGKDTLASGSEIADAAPQPGADRRWSFPTGTRLQVDGQLRGQDLYRVRLTPNTEAWVGGAFLQFDDSTHALPPQPGHVAEGPRFTDVVIGAAHAPFLVEAEPDRAVITVYGPATLPPLEPTGWLDALSGRNAPDSTVLVATPRTPLWGFKAFYDADGRLVVRLRHPPQIDPAEPLRGVRVLVDAGHPPAGATGPTRLTEAEANLAISLRLAEKLRQRGADVLMTRTGPEGMVSSTSVATELWARVDSAVAWHADVLVSVHNNAFPDGVNPFTRHGSETYYFHPLSRRLAETLIAEIAATTGVPNLGAKQRSLALVRPTWMPSTLTESLFMMFPQQEAALRDPAFLDRLADAHLRGIEAFLRDALAPSE